MLVGIDIVGPRRGDVLQLLDALRRGAALAGRLHLRLRILKRLHFRLSRSLRLPEFGRS